MTTNDQDGAPGIMQFMTGVAVCVSDRVSRVLEQNSTCLELCGNRVGTECERACTTVESGRVPVRGISVPQRRPMPGGKSECVSIANGDKIMTILLPRDAEEKNELAGLARFGLTPREIEIIGWVVSGMTNNEICKRLAISKSTLKTHLNNLYRKMPVEVADQYRKRGYLTRGNMLTTTPVKE